MLSKNKSGTSSITDSERLACATRGYYLQNKYLGGGAAGRVFLATVQQSLLKSNKRLALLEQVKQNDKSTDNRPLEVLLCSFFCTLVPPCAGYCALVGFAG